MKRTKYIRKIKFKRFIDENGILVPIEEKIDVPFKIARVFYISNLKKGDVRGEHAHRKCQQVLICLQGECEVVCDNGKFKKKFRLQDPTQALYIPPLVWTIHKFLKDGSIFLVLADQKFDESDYIRSYEDFLKLI